MTRVYRLDGSSVSLLIAIPPHGLPIIVHWGPTLAGPVEPEAIEHLLARGSRINGLDDDIAGAQALPTAGLGRFGQPALKAHRDGRDWSFSFAHPTVDAGPGRLTLARLDAVAGIEIAIDYRLDADDDVLRIATRLTNRGEADLTVDQLSAGSVLAPASARDMLGFTGQWGREFHEARLPVGHTVQVIENRRGRSSHDRWPGLILGAPGFTDSHGLVHGMHLGWSGNHRMIVEPLEDGRLMVQGGELYHPGECILAPGAGLTTPTLYASLGDGLDQLTERFHAHVRTRLLPWGPAGMTPRPVTLNTWEGNYFKHDVGHLQRQADAAAALGIERFVLDDGWFGRRDDDTTSLGDWIVDSRKYPNGLGELVEHVTGLGLEFGLWFEPEMVNPASDLFRAHPDWALQLAGRPLGTGRNQLVLDLSRPEVQEHLFGQIDAVLAAHAIGYVKWDMNRDLTAAGDGQGRAAYSRQTTGFYALLDRLSAAHPHVEFESCASGGGRADFGALARTVRVWTSDCTDALERLAIQRGFSRFLPPEIMGAHVSASPNHQTGRRHTLGFRALVALSGHFGVEMNPLTLSDDERAELAGYIALHKRLRPLLHGGRTYRRGPEGGRSLHVVVSAYRSHAVAIVAQDSMLLTEHPTPLAIPGLDPNARYRLSVPAPQQFRSPRGQPATARLLAGEVAVSGALLGAVGLNLPQLQPESALLIEFTRVD